MMKCSVKLNNYINLFTYDPVQTILNLLKEKKITQLDVSYYIGINERNTRKYFLRKTKLNKHFIIIISVITELPMLVTLELFKISGLEITLLDDGPLYFEFIKNMEKHTIEENLEIIFKNNL